MIARPNETLEEYVERFQYNLQRSPYASLPLPDKMLKAALIRGMKEQWIETLNIMGKADIYQESFVDIIDLCIRSSRGSTQIKPAEHDQFPVGNIPFPQPTLPSLQQNPQSNLRPQLPAQPNPNPNNRPVQALQILETPEEGPDLRECNDLQLISGCIIQTKGNKTDQIEDQLPREHLSQEEDVNRQQIHNQTTTSSPPFPERLVIPRPIQQPNFDILGELQILYIKIPFLQTIQDIPIYAKTIKELCIKIPRRNIIDNPRVQVFDTFSDLLSGKETPIKYEYPGNPIVLVQIHSQTLPNALVDLGAAINILTTATCQKLGITSAEPTSTLLELADRSVVRPKGILHDVMVSVDSWEYPTDFLIINPKT
eukprot:PITA_05832